MGLGSAVWNRHEGVDMLDERMYIAAVTGFTFYGLILVTLTALTTIQLGWRPGGLGFIGAGLVLPLVGTMIAVRSDNPPISLLGYTMVVLGMGSLLGPVVSMYRVSAVTNALVATAGVTLVTSIIGITYPKSLAHWGSFLFVGLLSMLFARVAQMLMVSFGWMPQFAPMPFLDYIGAILFSLYIVYDWNRALRIPRTWDNAIDCAMAIFLDIINLFLSLLRIFGRRR